MNETWKQRISILCSVFLSLAMFIIVLFNAIEGEAFKTQRYEDAYRSTGRAEAIGIEHEELMRVTDELMAYLKGNREELDSRAVINGEERAVFGEREVLHMVDVRNLFSAGYTIRYVMFAVVALCGFGLWRTGTFRALNTWPKCWYGVLGALGALCLIYGLWCIIDFSSAFTFFHNVLFTNDLWLLDPNTEVLIQMFPSQFFLDIMLDILGKFAFYLGMLTAVAVLIQVWLKKQAREEASRG